MRPLDAAEAASVRAALTRGRRVSPRRGRRVARPPGNGAFSRGARARCLGCARPPACAVDLVAGRGGCRRGAHGVPTEDGGGHGGAFARSSPAARAAVKEAAAFAATEDWLDAAVALALGRVTAQPHGGMDDAAKAALRERRARQRRAAGTLRACIARIGSDPIGAIANALDAMEWRPESIEAVERDVGEARTRDGVSSAEWTEGARAQAARQQAGARCAALRGLLLLLGAIRWGGSRVGAPPGCDRAAAALIPRAAAQHRASLLARWLTATPCEGVAADRVAPLPPPPLCAAILPADAASARPGLSLVVAGAALCAEIVLGPRGVATYRVDDGGYRRAVEVGARSSTPRVNSRRSAGCSSRREPLRPDWGLRATAPPPSAATPPRSCSCRRFARARTSLLEGGW